VENYFIKDEICYSLTIIAKTNVENIPPTKPSTVFFGESSISFVFPKKNPKI